MNITVENALQEHPCIEEAIEVGKSAILASLAFLELEDPSLNVSFQRKISGNCVGRYDEGPERILIAMERPKGNLRQFGAVYEAAAHETLHRARDIKGVAVPRRPHSGIKKLTSTYIEEGLATNFGITMAEQSEHDYTYDYVPFPPQLAANYVVEGRIRDTVKLVVKLLRNPIYTIGYNALKPLVGTLPITPSLYLSSQEGILQELETIAAGSALSEEQA